MEALNIFATFVAVTLLCTAWVAHTLCKMPDRAFRTFRKEAKHTK